MSIISLSDQNYSSPCPLPSCLELATGIHVARHALDWAKGAKQDPSAHPLSLGKTSSYTCQRTNDKDTSEQKRMFAHYLKWWHSAQILFHVIYLCVRLIFWDILNLSCPCSCQQLTHTKNYGLSTPLPKVLGKLPSLCVLRSSQGEGLLTASLCFRGHPEDPGLRRGPESKGVRKTDLRLPSRTGEEGAARWAGRGW